MNTKQLRRSEAIALLQRGHDGVARLVDGLAQEAVLRPGLGGGDWSAKDLLGI